MSQFKVVEIVKHGYKVALNAGNNKNIQVNDRFLIYALSDHEIIDPDTHKSLGFLEIVKGTGKVVHVQDKMCLVESDEYEISHPTRVTSTNGSVFGPAETIKEQMTTKELLPFDDPEIGDLAKRI